jgi:hypothetical protein
MKAETSNPMTFEFSTEEKLNKVEMEKIIPQVMPEQVYDEVSAFTLGDFNKEEVKDPHN